MTVDMKILLYINSGSLSDDADTCNLINNTGQNEEFSDVEHSCNRYDDTLVDANRDEGRYIITQDHSVKM
jgi:hypothetical protein